MKIPADLLPRDGRFGSGPSKVRTEALDALAGTGTTLMGTSHRREPVKRVVRSVREGLATLFDLPDGHEVVLGVGGSHAFFDAATFGLVRERAQLCVHGEFTRKLATAVARAPFLADPELLESEPTTHPTPHATAGVDAYCWAHNETSTGVMAPVERVEGAEEGALVLVDATSGAGGLAVDVGQTDAYYFAPQKTFASDGGLWVALMSPAAMERARTVSAERYVPAFLDLPTAIDNSVKDQTYNTPALATLFLLDAQLRWMLEQGGLDWAVARSRQSSDHLYAWAEAHPLATPFVPDPADRSAVVVTIDLDERVELARLSALLRENGIVDLDGYRGLGRNQLRIATFPAIDPDDVRALTACLDVALDHLR